MQGLSAPAHQLANQTTNYFGIDQTGKINYTFNSHGFRAAEFTEQPAVISFGNTITFGVGIPNELTFTSLVANALNLQPMNCSFGCYRHDNYDHLPNIDILSKRSTQDIILVQLNNINRLRTETGVVFHQDHNANLTRLTRYMQLVNTAFVGKTVVFLHWDNDPLESLPTELTEQIFIYNKFHLDCALATRPETFGVKSHDIIAKAILSQLRKLH